MLFDLFSEQSFEYKNEMIFILADLYLLHKDIFSKNQVLNLLEQIYFFCLQSQYQLLDVAQKIINDNLNNMIIIEITCSFIDDVSQTCDLTEHDSHYLINFLKKNSNIFKD